MNRLNMRGWSGAAFGGMARQTMGMSINPLNKQQPMPPQPMPPPATDTTIYYSFNVPFASHLAGPDTEDILHATRDAIVRWTHPQEAPDDVPVWDLPIHAANVNMLEKMCAGLCNGPLPIDAYVISAISPVNKCQVTTVVLSGSPDLVYKSRETILNDLPLSLRCTTVDIDGNMVADLAKGELKRNVLENLDHISANCGVDIFLLGPKLIPAVEGLGDTEMRRDQRFRVAIYGDVDSSEHAKTRVLILIDKMLGRIVDSCSLDPAVHALVCGRNKKNIKMIESATGTAIFFPPPYSAISRYLAPGAFRRKPDEIFITGETVQQIAMAKGRMQQTCNVSRVYAKDCHITPPKIESILFTRLDKIRKVLETNGNQATWPPLASQRNVVRIHGSDTNTVERTIRELMYLSGQFYSATWHINPANLDPRQLPSGTEIRSMLVEVCSNSNADVSFDRGQFSLTGFDDAVKDALEVMSKIPYLTQGPYQIRVKIELANEHKEFVSGKKNGKINKIMGQSNVQIVFDGFNEYNFHIDVVANSGYQQLKQGLSLVEAEMPASISFHVPDQYHKRIIGIGGQHIQRIMKKHSVFVKFSNAMDRGGIGREDDDVKVDNVVCRTPARNAQNLELVKNEILDMVDQADSELTSQVVHIDRLYHRQLISRMAEIDELEKRWNCKIIFPSTEQASDEVTISGPEWQVPHCVDAFLGMVPDQHELILEETSGLVDFLQSPKFRGEICTALKNNYEVSLSVRPNPDELSEKGEKTIAVTASFTRNCAGGLRDALDFIYNEFTTAGITVSVVKGSLPRPKSDSFEESMPFFDSKLLQAPTAVPPESPGNKSTFGEEVARERSTIFDKLRKPSSMAGLSSFLDRRKNSSQSINSSFFKGSANVSKTSLISIESTRSFHADRNPWNDSGVNLPEDDSPWPIRPFSNGIDHKTNNNGTTPGDATPRHNTRPSADSGRPSTSHSANSGYPGAPAPFR